MIYTCIESVEIELNYLNILRDHLREYLHNTRQYNKSYLNVEYKNGVRYYHRICEQDGIKTRRYVGKCDNPGIQVLHRRAYAKKALELCENNIKLLTMVVAKHRSLEPQEVIKGVGKAYQEAEYVAYEVMDITSRNEWLVNEERICEEAGPYKPEGLRHISEDGVPKRSKGEVIIANTLLSQGLCYIYEPVRRINGIDFRPDFVVYNDKTGEEVIIEYMGMLNDEQYRRDAHRKIENYILGGYTLGKDLMIFMDNEDGNIDSCKIKKIMEAFLA